MNDEVRAGSTDGSVQIDHGTSASRLAREVLKTDHTRRIVVASSFTGDPILRPLQFWMDALDIPASVSMAPYAQVMQQLLNKESDLYKNTGGYNVLLVRLEDWIRDRRGESFERNVEHLHRAVHEFVAALASMRAIATSVTLVFVGPNSSSLPPAYRAVLDELQREIVIEMGSLAGVHCWSHRDLADLYPVPSCEDALADRIGHVPYTEEYFVAIATVIARRIAELLKPRRKAIVLDCDDTLWKGICGEDGPSGIEITPGHRELQELLVRQHDAGVLLCVCSKNNSEDVEAVFRAHPDMPLRAEHIVSSRVNWSSKSSNVVSISQELELSLDSFIFIDNDAAECAEVEARCPSVLALRFPTSASDIRHFLRHVWAFDRTVVTDEARQRTAQYRLNQARRKALEGAPSLEQYLASLELRVDISVMQQEQLARVAELIQRTNQFNLTTIRRTAADIATLLARRECDCLVVHVSDRFGEYGLVGAVLLNRTEHSIEVETFVLSCRVLGRGVEHKIVIAIGKMARLERRRQIVLKYRKTGRNEPARLFVEGSFLQFKAPQSSSTSTDDLIFEIPVDYAETLKTSLSEARITDLEAVRRSAPTIEPEARTEWHELAFRLSHIADVVREIEQSGKREGPADPQRIAPGTDLEKAIATIWKEVLCLEEFGVNADFFGLGGDSLLAVQVIARIASRLGTELSITDFFDAPTVAQLALKVGPSTKTKSIVAHIGRSQALPLSRTQQRLWFIDQLELGSAAYHIPVCIRLHGALDRMALTKALDTLLIRHEVLREIFEGIDGEPVARISTQPHFALELGDLSERNAEERESELLRQAQRDLCSPIDLSTGPCIRGRLLQLTDHENALLLIVHHMIFDGWSIGVLLRELGLLYEAYCEGRENPLPRLPIQYADYAEWQQRTFSGKELETQLRYWKEHLSGAPTLLELPMDRPRPPIQSYRGASARVSLGRNVTTSLKELSHRLNVTLAMASYAAWAILLCRLSGHEDIVVGMPVANRRRTEFEGLIGFFVNTLATRIRLDDNPSVTELLQRVKEIMLGAYSHQDAPFEQIVEMQQPSRSMSHTPLFQVMFAWHSATRASFTRAGLKFIEQEVPLCSAQFDLTLSLQESEDGISGSLNYATDLFDQATIARWIGILELVLNEMVRDPERKVREITIVGPTERDQILGAFNATDAPSPDAQLIHELVEDQLRRTPDAVSVTYERGSLSCEELGRRANQLAGYLIRRGLRPDQLVALCVERGLEMVVGIMGILKAGAAYVPLDPDYPLERTREILKGTHARLLLTQEALKSRCGLLNLEVVTLDTDWGEIGRWPQNCITPSPSVTPYNLAYVIHTSGSTGRPKGVMVEHAQVVNFLNSMRQAPGMTAKDCIASVTTLSFDIAALEIFLPLVTGARLVLTSRAVASDARLLAAHVAEAQATVMQATPATWQMLLSGEWDGRSALKVLCGGEPLPAELSEELRRRSGSIWNLYGPTETTIWSCCGQLTESVGRGAVEPIGRPIANTRIYILDTRLQPAPIGVNGEIHIGGAGVSRGYLYQPHITAERFIADPFSSNSQARTYRTGDLGRWRPDGTIEYAGRTDQQIKLRGFRIELGEVEAYLAQHERVMAAAVIAREDTPGDKRLVAYVVPKSDRGVRMELTAETLRKHLKELLPDYMVPTAFVMLEHLPLTPNRKLNRRALPAPERGAYVCRHYEEPQGELEEVLAEIWRALLGTQRVGRQDNFFDLGGHSLLATRVISRLREKLHLELPVRLLFDAPTLADLSSRVEAEASFRAAQESMHRDDLAQNLRRQISEMHDDLVLAHITKLEEELGQA